LSQLASLQGLLVKGTASEHEHAGQIRPVQVVTGRRESAPPSEIPTRAAHFVPPSPGAELEAGMRDLAGWMHTDHGKEIDPVVAVPMGHYEFEALPPFRDGSGRIGRLLIVLQLNRAGALSEPTLSVSPWFEARRGECYDPLLGVSTEGDWSTWVEFFSLGLAESADATRERMLALAAMQEELKEHLRSTP
jgi:Fic family protein